jgi:16S rRNA processing protein RimM
MGPADQRICVARIGAPHGVRGEVKFWSFTADPAAIVNYGPFTNENGTVSFEIEAIRPAKDFFVARIKGITDRNAAERLRNVDLYVPRERLPEPEDEGEFYHADLIGLEVVDRRGVARGAVVAVHNFGAGDLIEVRLPDRSDTVMIPFTQAAVPVVDIPGGRIVVDPPDGLSLVEAPSSAGSPQNGEGK